MALPLARVMKPILLIEGGVTENMAGFGHQRMLLSSSLDRAGFDAA
jgi:hypothetical protein